jgi:hypothetical protein
LQRSHSKTQEKRFDPKRFYVKILRLDVRNANN